MGAHEDALAARTARQDEDRALAARFAPRPVAGRLMALYAVHAEVARTAETVSEPMLGDIRLAWWAEALAEIAAGGPVRGHEAARALAEALKDAAAGPALAALGAVIEARRRDLDPAPFATIEELALYAEATAGGLAAAAAALCLDGPIPAHVAGAARLVGRAWGLTGLARAYRFRLAANQAPVAEETLASLGLRRAALARGDDAAAARAVLTPLLDAADAAQMRLAALAPRLPAEVWPAFGYVCLARGYRRRMRAPGFDPCRHACDRPLLARQLALVASALSGGL